MSGLEMFPDRLLRDDKAMLEAAVKAFLSTTEEFTRKGAPRQWASVQINLGNTLRHLGKLTRVIAHPTLSSASTGSLATNTNRRTASTDARLAFVVLTTERKAA